MWLVGVYTQYRKVEHVIDQEPATEDLVIAIASMFGFNSNIIAISKLKEIPIPGQTWYRPIFLNVKHTYTGTWNEKKPFFVEILSSIFKTKKTSREPLYSFLTTESLGVRKLVKRYLENDSIL